jgi:hypothetical protein
MRAVGGWTGRRRRTRVRGRLRHARYGWVGTAKGGFEARDGGRSWTPIEFGAAVNKIRILPAGNTARAYAIGAEMHAFGPPREMVPPRDAERN